MPLKTAWWGLGTITPRAEGSQPASPMSPTLRMRPRLSEGLPKRCEFKISGKDKESEPRQFIGEGILTQIRRTKWEPLSLFGLGQLYYYSLNTHFHKRTLFPTSHHYVENRRESGKKKRRDLFMVTWKWKRGLGEGQEGFEAPSHDSLFYWSIIGLILIGV